MIRGRTPREVSRYDWLKGGIGLAIFASLLGTGAAYQPISLPNPEAFGLDRARNVSPVGLPLEAMHGRGLPESVLTIRVDGADYGRVMVDERGRWKLDRPLLAGRYQVEIVKLNERDETDATYGPFVLEAGIGGTPPPEEASPPPVEPPVVAEAPEPKAPKVPAPESLGGLDADANSRPAMDLPADPLADVSRVTWTERAQVTLDQKERGKPIPDGLILLSGEAGTDMRVEIYADGKLVGRARGDAEGRWRARVDVRPGTRQIAVRAAKGEVRGSVWQAPK